MSTEFQHALEVIKNNETMLDKYLSKKSEIITKVGTLLTRYLEITETTTTMLRAAGAEIEGKGRADRRLVLGKSEGFIFKQKSKGTSLVNHYGEKQRILFALRAKLEDLHHIDQLDFKLATQIDHEVHDEDRTVQKQSHQENPRLQKKIRRVENILEKVETELNRQQKDIRKQENEIDYGLRGVTTIQQLVYSQGRRVKHLCGNILAKHYFHVISKHANTERKFVMKEFRDIHYLIRHTIEEVTQTARITKQIQECFEIIQGKSHMLHDQVTTLKKQTKHLKKLDRVDRIERKFIRRMRQVKDIQDFHEDRESTHLIKEGQQEEKAASQLFHEEKDLEVVEETMVQLIGKIQQNAGQSGTYLKQIESSLHYCITAYQSSRRFKRNPSAVIPYLEKVKEYVKSSIGKVLDHLQEEIHNSEIESEKETEIFQSFAHIISKISATTDRRVKKVLKDTERTVNKLEKDLRKEMNKSIKDLHKLQQEESKDKKVDRLLNRAAAKAGEETGSKYMADASHEKQELGHEEQEIHNSISKLTQETESAKKLIKKAEQELPDFRILRKGISGAVSYRRMKKMANKILREEHKEEHQQHQVIQTYNHWLHDFFSGKSFLDFLESFSEESAKERQSLEEQEQLFKSFKKQEQKLLQLFEQLETSLEHFGQASQQLQRFETEFSAYISNSQELIETTKNELHMLHEELQELKHIQPIIHGAVQTIPALEQAIEQQKEYEKDVRGLLREGKQKVRPEVIATQNIVSEKQAA